MYKFTWEQVNQTTRFITALGNFADKVMKYMQCPPPTSSNNENFKPLPPRVEVNALLIG